MRAHLILNGDIDKKFLKQTLCDSSHIYVVDGAFNKVSSLQLNITAILGDLDSIRGIPNNIDVIELEDQNFTDFEKAIMYLKSTYQEIYVYGSSGGAIDHCIGNLHAANNHIGHVNINFIDPCQTYFMINTPTDLKDIKDNIISIIPFPTIHNLITKGLEFPVKNITLAIEKKLSIRNKAIDNVVSISFDKGSAAVFISAN